jgi:hypothetical protein
MMTPWLLTISFAPSMQTSRTLLIPRFDPIRNEVASRNGYSQYSAVLESTDSRLYFHLLPYFVLRLYLASLVCPFNSFTLSNA